MTEEERKIYFKGSVEYLYKTLATLAETTLPNKKERAAKLIHEFYKEYKEEYGIKNIGEVTEELDRVNVYMKESGVDIDIKNMYDGEEPGDK